MLKEYAILGILAFVVYSLTYSVEASDVEEAANITAVLINNKTIPVTEAADILTTANNQTDKIIDNCTAVQVSPGENASMKLSFCKAGMFVISEVCKQHSSVLIPCTDSRINSYAKKYNLTNDNPNASKNLDLLAMYEENSHDLGLNFSEKEEE